MKTLAKRIDLACMATALGLCFAACNQNMVMQPAVTGRPLYGVDINNNLVRFGSGSPGMVTNMYPLNGLPMGEIILGIDFRPLDQRLYALGSSSRIYVIDTLSGGTISIGANSFSPSILGSAFGFDFNPVPDRIRLHSTAGQDLRLNPDSGGLSGRDSTLAYALGDVNSGLLPNVTGTAYTNSIAGATSTSLYAIDSILDILTYLPSPNNGQMWTVGALGVNTSDLVGFDIAGRDSTAAFAALYTGDPTRLSGLYTINLATGAATMVGLIGTPGTHAALRALAIAPR